MVINAAYLVAPDRTICRSATTLDKGKLSKRVRARVYVFGLHAGRDLRALFALLRQDRSGRVPRHTMLLLRLLAAVARHEGPTAFFDFSGGAGGIMRSGDLRLPGARHLDKGAGLGLLWIDPILHWAPLELHWPLSCWS